MEDDNASKQLQIQKCGCFTQVFNLAAQNLSRNLKKKEKNQDSLKLENQDYY